MFKWGDLFAVERVCKLKTKIFNSVLEYPK